MGRTARRVDDGSVHRRGLRRGGEGAMTAIRVSAGCLPSLRRRVAAGTSTPRRAVTPQARRGAARHHRLLGVGGQRGLALADGDAAQGRLREPAAQRRGRARGRRLESGAGEAGRRVQAVRRRGDHARARPRAHRRGPTASTLLIETDAGQQTRRLRFGAPAAAGWRTNARGEIEWFGTGAGRAGRRPAGPATGRATRRRAGTSLPIRPRSATPRSSPAAWAPAPTAPASWCRAGSGRSTSRRAG